MGRTMEHSEDRRGGDALGPEASAGDVEWAFAEARRRIPTRPRGRVPACEGCSEAEPTLSCDCCGQELCPECWGTGTADLCQGCVGYGWDDGALAVVEVARGLLR